MLACAHMVARLGLSFGAPATAAAAGQDGVGAGASGAAQEPAGMMLFLSEIKEWVAEFGCDMLRISIRTDVAWYCLDQCALPQPRRI